MVFVALFFISSITAEVVSAEETPIVARGELVPITARLLQSESPGNEQREYWSSSAADIAGTRNFAGIKNPVIDKIIESIISAPSRQELVNATRALDRILLWEHYVIPQWHIAKYRVAYWNKFSRPKIIPRYSLGFDTWWVDPKKNANLVNYKRNQKK